MAAVCCAPVSSALVPHVPEGLHSVARRRRSHINRATSSTDSDFVVLGAGVVGLACARALLQKSEFSPGGARVTVIEHAGQLCTPNAGTATGAGQGYIWMGHREPANRALWQLAARGAALWREEVAGLSVCGAEGVAADADVGYRARGSLLLSRDANGAQALAQRAADLATHGVQADVLSPEECMKLEALLHVPPEGAALQVDDDFQIDAKAACTWLLQSCEALGCRKNSSFRVLFGCNVCRIAMDCSGSVKVETSCGRFRGKRGVVVAMGCDSGKLICSSFGDRGFSDIIKKRWGQLLAVPYPEGVQALQHGAMDVTYTSHYSQSQHSRGPEADITFTACTSADGQLLLGSSRHEAECFEDVNSEDVRDMIVEEACLYLPELASYLRESQERMTVRWGPRPASTRGLPYIGRVYGCEGLIIAAGHEGSGLTMALATADIVTALLKGDTVPAYADAFAV